METVTRDIEARLASIADEHGRMHGGLLPALHAVQNAFGYVPSQAVGVLAKELNLSRAEVHGVLTYYHHFRDTPPGRHVVRLCLAEACIACGSNDLAKLASARLGCEMNSTRDDGEVTLEPVYCLGLCASSPAAQINGRPYGCMTAQKLDEVMTSLGVRA